MKPQSYISFEERRADQVKARERQAEKAKQFAAKPIGSKEAVERKRQTKVIPHPISSVPDSRPIRSWAKVQAGEAALQLYARSEPQRKIFPQPWTSELVTTLLGAANDGGIHLCLTWPIALNSLAILHGLATIERLFSRDLKGMRTLLFPGTYSSRASLQAVLADRSKLSELYRSLWEVKESNSVNVAHTQSQSMLGALSALNDIHCRDQDIENPSVGEVIPAFIYEADQHEWSSVLHSPLERTLKKVERLAHRKNIRNMVNAEWGDSKTAPAALMVLHHSSRKDVWREALGAPALRGDGMPEVLLLDATEAAERTSYSAVRKIPEFLKYARDNGYQDTGSVIVTDDPKIFLVLRARLKELKLDQKNHIWAAEGDESILSSNPTLAGLNPNQRSNANFSVGIVDRDASQVALAFQRLAGEAGKEGHPAHSALMAACLYILRLSNMPAGYKDLTADAAENGGQDFSSQRNAWAPIKLTLQSILQNGTLNAKRTEVEQAIFNAEKLIDTWSDSTPMAARLLAEVKRYALDGKEGLSIVLPNQKYILLAHQFLKRKLECEWVTVEGRLGWYTLSSVNKTLTADRNGRHFVFVGVSRGVLRLVLTHPAIPHGTTILIAYKQAEATLTTLLGMKEIDAFKPYRGRMGLLAQELDRRLKEVPNPLVIGKLGDMSMTFRLDDDKQLNMGKIEQDYYKFELEGGGQAYASGWLYRYEPDEDPFFRRAAASSVKVGEFIFEMSDELRSKLENALQLKSDGLGSVVYPERALLKLYHDDVKRRCELLFGVAKSRAALARGIHIKMIEIDSSVIDCRPGRVYYWLALQSDSDTKPHAAKDGKFFKIFCKALGINDEQALQHWNFIRNARRLNQNLGRELAARYAEILFQPESAVIYRKVSDAEIKHLQQDALRCVYRVERVIPPPSKAAA